jgi:hypothetical protein
MPIPNKDNIRLKINSIIIDTIIIPNAAPQLTLNIDLYTPKTAIKAIINPERSNIKFLYTDEINTKIIIIMTPKIHASRLAPIALKNDVSLPKSLAAK